MNGAPSQIKEGDPVIEFRSVSMYFGEHRVLEGVSFTLQRGEMIVLTGDSGSGKTVLLQLAIGLLKPESGQILIEGRDLAELSEPELLALRSRQMGLVFQRDTLFTGLSVYDNTAFRLTEHEWPEEEIEPAVHEILRFVGLENDLEKLPEEMSIGMRRRLELARALVGWPAIMLFDEPTAGLDPINARQVLDLIIRARDLHGITSVLVTKELHQIPHLVKYYALEDRDGTMHIHERDLAAATQLRVMVLEDGKLAFTGSYTEFANSPLPSVQHLTHPDTGQLTTDSYIQDPWSGQRRIREEGREEEEKG